MASVDPFVYPIPKELQNDREVRAYFEYLNRFLHDIWVRTGGSSDAIASAELKESYPWPTSSLAEESENVIQFPTVTHEPKELRCYTVTADATVLPSDFVNCKNRATITFPLYPEENATVVIRNGDGSTIRMLGNGRKINGSSSGAIYRLKTTIEWSYFLDTDEWFAK